MWIAAFYSFYGRWKWHRTWWQKSNSRQITWNILMNGNFERSNDLQRMNMCNKLLCWNMCKNGNISYPANWNICFPMNCFNIQLQPLFTNLCWFILSCKHSAKRPVYALWQQSCEEMFWIFHETFSDDESIHERKTFKGHTRLVVLDWSRVAYQHEAFDGAKQKQYL